MANWSVRMVQGAFRMKFVYKIKGMHETTRIFEDFIWGLSRRLQCGTSLLFDSLLHRNFYAFISLHFWNWRLNCRPHLVLMLDLQTRIRVEDVLPALLTLFRGDEIWASYLKWWKLVRTALLSNQADELFLAAIQPPWRVQCKEACESNVPGEQRGRRLLYNCVVQIRRSGSEKEVDRIFKCLPMENF